LAELNFVLTGKILNLHESQVWLNGRELSIAPSQKVSNRSSGFTWGYGGSGPAQLALAILLDLKGEAFAKRHYQKFKWDVIAELPVGKGFSEILTWAYDEEET
jgi:hypothetical protein